MAFPKWQRRLSLTESRGKSDGLATAWRRLGDRPGNRLATVPAKRYKACATHRCHRGHAATLSPPRRSPMTNLLILLTFPETIRNQYRDRLQARFPELAIAVVDHHSKAGPHIGKADALLTFAPMLSSKVLQDGTRLKWIQALGTGTDNLTDQAALRKDVIVTNVRGIHGPPVSEAALAGMLALARDLPRAVRAQASHQWQRWPAQLLHNKTVGIFGIGLIAEALAPKCKAFGMRVIGVSSAPRSRFRRYVQARGASRRGRRVRFLRAADTTYGEDARQHRRGYLRPDETVELFDQSGARRRSRRAGIARGSPERPHCRRGARRLHARAPGGRSSALGYAERHYHHASGRLLRRLYRSRAAYGGGEHAMLSQRRARPHDQCRGALGSLAARARTSADLD